MEFFFLLLPRDRKRGAQTAVRPESCVHVVLNTEKSHTGLCCVTNRIQGSGLKSGKILLSG